MILKESVIRSIILSTLSMSSITIIRMLTQIMVLPVLARLLTPAEYGLVGMAMPLILFVMIFSDVGMTNSLLREKSKVRDEKEWSTSFWLLTGLGVLISTLISGIAPFIAYALNEPKLGPIIITLSIAVLLQSMSAIPGTVLMHDKRFRTIAGIEIFSMAASIALTFYSAVNGAGVWSLVVQQVGHYTCRFILTFLYSRFKPKMTFDYQKIKNHLKFGKNLLGSNTIGNLMPMLNNFIIGHQLGVAAVGFVNIAQIFSQLPARIVSGPLQFVLYPYMAQERDNTESIKIIFIFATRLIATIIIPLLGMVAVAHEPIFRIFLSEKWHLSGEIFMILAPASALQAVTALRFTLMMSLGRTDMMLKQSMESAILSLIVLAITINYGLETIVMGMCLTSFLYFPRSISKIIPLIKINISTYIMTMFIPTIITILAISAYKLINIYQHIENNWALFSISFTLGIISALASLGLQLKTIKKELAKLKTYWMPHSHQNTISNSTTYS